MPVIAHSQSDYVEAWNLRPFQPKSHSDFCFVECGGPLRIQFARHSSYLYGLDGHLVEKSFAHHPVIALRIFRRNSPLINKEDFQLLPGNLRTELGLGIPEEFQHPSW